MKLLSIFFCAALALVGSASAQDFTISAVGPASATEGSSFSAQFLLDNPTDLVEGFSYGVCQANCVATNLTTGADLAAVNGGDGPDFNTYAILADGFGGGVVFSLLGAFTLPAGQVDWEMFVADYDVTGLEGQFADVTFCNLTLGMPPIENVIVTGGLSFGATEENLSVEITGVPDEFQYVAPTATIQYSNGVTSVNYDAEFDLALRQEFVDFGATPSDTQGFSCGLGHPAGTTVNSVSAINDLLALNGGTGPEFFTINLLPDAFTIGAVYALTGGVDLQFSPIANANNDIAANYDTDVPVAADEMSAVDTVVDLSWADTFGMPPVENVVVVAGNSFPAELTDGQITLTPQFTPDHRNGDCNHDGIINIADVVFGLQNSFAPGATGLPCLAACDLNRDGAYDVDDAIFIIDFQFNGGPPPQDPFPACESSMEGTCDDFSSCP